MPQAVNLSREMEGKLPPELTSFLRMAADIALSQGENLYLVGGAVRDLMLGKVSYDIDLAVEGNGVKLASEIAGKIGARLTTHPQFGTAKLEWQGKWDIDIVSARQESYAHPGALPAVSPGSIKDDLFRRDFTVNAMAIALNAARWGELFDPYGGKADLERKLIRILHDKSFIDDATRIWRGVRYASRLDFSIEEHTLALLKRDIPMLDTISGDRIRYELECVLREEIPEKALSYAYELDVLQKIHPALKADEWLANTYRKARAETSVGKPSPALYLAILIYNLRAPEVDRFINFLRFDRTTARVLNNTNELRRKERYLSAPDITSSQIYHLVHTGSQLAIQAGIISTGSEVIRERLKLYLNKLRYVKPSLTGEDLKKMGVPERPEMKKLLERLLDARLDGKVNSREEEEEMVRKHLGRQIQ